MNSDQQRAVQWARDLLNRADWCILDTETTGLQPQAEIVQIAILSSDGETLLNSLCKPTIPISPDASAIHHITDAMVADAPEFADILPEIASAIAGKDTLIYNAKFDCKVIHHCCQIHDLSNPLSPERHQSVICAMGWYAQWVGKWDVYHQNYIWPKLPEGDHSALGDCKATLKAIQQMAHESPPPADPSSAETEAETEAEIEAETESEPLEIVELPDGDRLHRLFRRVATVSNHGRIQYALFGFCDRSRARLFIHGLATQGLHLAHEIRPAELIDDWNYWECKVWQPPQKLIQTMATRSYVVED